MEIRQNKA